MLRSRVLVASIFIPSLLMLVFTSSFPKVPYAGSVNGHFTFFNPSSLRYSRITSFHKIISATIFFLTISFANIVIDMYSQCNLALCPISINTILKIFFVAKLKKSSLVTFTELYLTFCLL